MWVRVCRAASFNLPISVHGMLPVEGGCVVSLLVHLWNPGKERSQRAAHCLIHTRHDMHMRWIASRLSFIDLGAL